MELDASFAAFLEEKVNLKSLKLDRLDDRVGAITRALKADDDIGPRYRKYVKQGSWAHRTIIEPVGAFDEFDADFLLHLKEEPAWADSPKQYLAAVRAAFKRHSTYASMTERKNRCVRIRYAGSCHVDVVPYITLADGREVIVNYAEDKFEDTNPTGFAAWMREKDDLANGNLRLVIRLMKYLRDYKNTFSCPSVILTTLLGQRVTSICADTRYTCVAATLLHILEDLVTYLAGYWYMPTIEDPSCPGTTFSHRWDQAQYETFKTKVGTYASWAREALDAPDEASSVTAWRRLFGDEFTAPEVRELAKSMERRGVVQLAVPTGRQLVERAPGEQFVEEHHRVAIRYAGRIDARVVKPSGCLHPRTFRSDWSLKPGRSLRFEVTTDAPQPYQVIWKVRNRGEMAARLGQLRGRLIYNAGNRHRETTRYVGRHFVEVYIVKDGVVVAADRVDVVIE